MPGVNKLNSKGRARNFESKVQGPPNLCNYVACIQIKQPNRSICATNDSSNEYTILQISLENILWDAVCVMSTLSFIVALTER